MSDISLECAIRILYIRTPVIMTMNWNQFWQQGTSIMFHVFEIWSILMIFIWKYNNNEKQKRIMTNWLSRYVSLFCSVSPNVGV